MIYGVGCDIAKVSRFMRWLDKPGFLERIFAEGEILPESDGPLPERKRQRAAEHYAARFAAKEAFSKALGTGLFGFSTWEVCVAKDGEGRPELVLSGAALDLFRKRCGGEAKIHLSISHEREFASAFVVIELVP